MADSMHAGPATGDLASPLVQRMRRHQAVAVLFRTVGPAALGRGRGAMHQGTYVMAMRADDAQRMDATRALPPTEWAGEQPASAPVESRPAPAVHPEPRAIAPGEPAVLAAAPPPATPMPAPARQRGKMANIVRTFAQRLISGTPAEDNRAAPAALQSEPAGEYQDTPPAGQAAVSHQPVQLYPPGQQAQAFAAQPSYGAERVDTASTTPAISATPVPGVPSAAPPVQAAALQGDARPGAASAAAHQQPRATLPPPTLPSSQSLTGPSATNSGSPPGDSLDWGRLTAILRAHERQEQSDAANTEAANATGQAAKPLPAAFDRHTDPAGALPDTQAPAVVSLAAAGSVTAGVQRTELTLDAAGGQTEAGHALADPAPDPTPGSAADGLLAVRMPGVDAEPDVAQLLRAVPPARATESAVHVIAPRGPRPIQRRTAHTPPEPGGAEGERPQPAGGMVHIPMVPTEIGELPVDLWGLIGEAPPTTSAAPLSPADKPAIESYPGPTAGPMPDSSVDPGAAAASWRGNASAPAAPQPGAPGVAFTGDPDGQLPPAGAPPDAILAAPRSQPMDRQTAAAGHSTEQSQAPVQRRAISLAEAVHAVVPASEISAVLPGPTAEISEPYPVQEYAAGVSGLPQVTGIERVDVQAAQTASGPAAPHVLQAVPAPSLETPGSGVDAVMPLGSVNGPRPQALSNSALSAGAERVQRQLAEETANAAAPSEALSRGVSENLTGQIGRPESILSTPTAPAGGDPDVQQLAGLVYIELRRRLAVERERLG
jgi:hypothetical protein